MVTLFLLRAILITLLLFLILSFKQYLPEEAGARTIVYVEGNNPVLILDENLTAVSTPLGDIPQLRQTTENDKVSFGASVLLGTVQNNGPESSLGGFCSTQVITGY